MGNSAQRDPARIFLIASGIFAAVAIAFLGYEILSVTGALPGEGSHGPGPSLEKREQVVTNLNHGPTVSSSSVKMSERQQQLSNLGSGRTPQPTAPQTSPQQQGQLDAQLKALDSLNSK